jgi:uridine kinase
VAIVGGSGSGKSWLAAKLEQALAPHALRISLDDFYLDRSHVSPARRARLNFDHPRAVNWQELRQVLAKLLAGRSAVVPRYDFATHCRQPGPRLLRPKPILLLEGLWLLRRVSLRRHFALSIFLDCPGQTRLRRRLARDRSERGRSRAGVEEQFRGKVEPMHRRYVQPQARWADLVLPSPLQDRQFREVLGRLERLL